MVATRAPVPVVRGSSTFADALHEEGVEYVSHAGVELDASPR